MCYNGVVLQGSLASCGCLSSTDVNCYYCYYYLFISLTQIVFSQAAVHVGVARQGGDWRVQLPTRAPHAHPHPHRHAHALNKVQDAHKPSHGDARASHNPEGPGKIFRSSAAAFTTRGRGADDAAAEVAVLTCQPHPRNNSVLPGVSSEEGCVGGCRSVGRLGSPVCRVGGRCLPAPVYALETCALCYAYIPPFNFVDKLQQRRLPHKTQYGSFSVTYLHNGTHTVSVFCTYFTHHIPH